MTEMQADLVVTFWKLTDLVTTNETPAELQRFEELVKLYDGDEPEIENDRFFIRALLFRHPFYQISS